MCLSTKCVFFPHVQPSFRFQDVLCVLFLEALSEDFFYIYINYIIHCKIKKDNHQVPKIIRAPGNKTNPKKIK